jgi:hypothetical protein
MISVRVVPEMMRQFSTTPSSLLAGIGTRTGKADDKTRQTLARHRQVEQEERDAE